MEDTQHDHCFTGRSVRKSTLGVPECYLRVERRTSSIRARVWDARGEESVIPATLPAEYEHHNTHTLATTRGRQRKETEWKEKNSFVKKQKRLQSSPSHY